MTDRKQGLTDEELAAEAGEELPDREAMSLVNANIAVPVNAAGDGRLAADSTVYRGTHRSGQRRSRAP